MARPAEFDRHIVLQKAMQAFWEKGYNATSIAVLSETTQLNPGSLYNTFQSKEAIFLEAIDHYGETGVRQMAAFLSSSQSALSGLRQLFHQWALDAHKGGPECTCFLVNTVLEVSRHHPAVRENVNKHLAAVETLIRETLQLAQAQGELDANKDVNALASFLICNIWGLRVLGGTLPSYKKAMAIVSQTLSVLD